ncbi:putative ribonucleotide transport ATP-binding protein mkl [bioreactor metagenome]|uniref:Putative ribonucleotide transport ATP-binding protein mkl n=1 Tax=bioreactor metagenome TaxID=1076179 RepID=A0A644YGC4_9ZZZZ
MIEVLNINKSFDGKQVLKNISVTLEPGVNNLIIGQSGSGKTVLLKCLLGLHQVDNGEIIFDGRHFTSMKENEQKKVRQEIGTVFQGGALFDSMTVEQNVTFPLDMFTKMTRNEKKERVNFCLRRVDLHHASKLMPSEISGGMKKRVAIARAIVMNPRYLFCDEPNSGLDPKTSILIDQLISELTKEFNMTTVINTHDMNSVIEIGDRIAFIYKGNMWWKGNNQEILNSDNKELNDFIFSTQLTRHLKK